MADRADTLVVHPRRESMMMPPNKWLERTMLASRRLLEGEQAPRRMARRSATPFDATWPMPG